MSTPVVVQGKPVTLQPATTGFASSLETTAPPSSSGGGGGTRQDKVETKCNDPIFAVLFYIAMFAIVAVAAIYGPDALSGTSEYDYSGYVTVAVILVVVSFVCAGIGMMVLMCIPQFLIKTALIFTVVMAGVWMVLSFISGQIFSGVIGAIIFAISLCYARAVWSRIPFATANLVTAATAIKQNIGVSVYAYIFAILGGGWSVCWSIAFVGVLDKTYECNDVTNVCSNPSYGLLFVLFLALFFVQQVLQSCIHVTVAGVTGTWWYSPSEASSCCSSAVNNSMIRTVTTSFGSICFGSLLVAIVQALRALADSAQQNGDAQILACIAQCILACLASILEYFNKWAFIYVGIYGMPYLKAGKSVIELFQNRGWEAVIADDLVGNVLFLISLIVAGVMGGIGLIMYTANEDLFSGIPEENAKPVAFFLGFLIGLIITSILMSTIGSGVNAVVVLFAEGPSEFQQNHPELSNKMREAWNQVYPGSL